MNTLVKEFTPCEKFKLVCEIGEYKVYIAKNEDNKDILSMKSSNGNFSLTCNGNDNGVIIYRDKDNKVKILTSYNNPREFVKIGVSKVSQLRESARKRDKIQ